MKFFRKMTALVMCLVMTLSIAACGKRIPGDSDNHNPNPNPGVTYTVSFDVGADAKAAGVNNPAPIQVESGSTVALPAPDNYTGYVFRYWMLNNAMYIASTPVTSDITLVAHYITESEANEEAEGYESQIASWSEPGHLYLHYKRYSHSESEQGTVNTGAPDYSSAINSTVYGDWGLWAWPKNGEGRLFNAMKIDLSGAVYDILLDHTYTDAGWDSTNLTHSGTSMSYGEAKEIGLQLFMISSRLGSGFWSNDGGNNYVVLDRIAREVEGGTSYHWFVTQGNVTQGSGSFSTEEVDDPYAGIEEGSATSNGNINSLLDNSVTYPLANKAAGYDDAGVGYQIFVASFADSDGDGMGDLRGIINKLDYLESLNVDVLWLTPFQTSTNYHGYDIKDYFSVDSRFGTLSDYRELTYKVHQRGMKIVMDYVLNHTAQSNPWFVKSQNLVRETVTNADGTESTINYRNFYNWINEEQYQALSDAAKEQWYQDAYGYYFYSSFSSDMPELNYDYQPVRDAILDVAEYWMSFGLDGFRLDAVKHIYMKNETISGGHGTIVDGDNALYAYDQTRDLNFYREFNYRLKASYPNAFLLGENLDGNPTNTAPFYRGLDSQFNFNLYYDVGRSIAATATSGNESWLGGALTAYTNGHTKYSAVNPHYIDGQFTSNHDLPRARDRINVTTDGMTDTYRSFMNGSTPNASLAKTSEELLRLYYAFNMTIPGLSWIYYGDELGMTGVMKSKVSGGEESAHEDRIYRQPMKWFDEVSKNSSFDIGYGTLKVELEGLNTTEYVHGVDVQDADAKSLLNWTRTLTKCRNDHPELINGTLTTVNNSGSIIIYKLTGKTGTTKIYINTGSTYTVSEASNSANVYAGYNLSGTTLAKNGVAIVKG